MQPVEATNRAKPIAIGVGILTFLAMLLALAVPTPPGNSWLEFHHNLSVNLGTFLLFVGASILFLISLKGFTPKLKRAYFLICGGMTLFGLAYLQVPLLVLSDQLGSFWVNTGLILMPFLAGVIIVFTGMRAFTKLIGISHITLKYWFAIAGSIVLAALIVVMPHPPFVSLSEVEYDAGQVALIVFAWWIGLTACHALLIRRRGGLTYTNATAWLSLCMSCVAASATLVPVLSLMVSEDMLAIPTNIAYPINLLASLLCLRAAYSFNRITAEANTTERWVARNFFGKPLQARGEGAVSSVDIVVYAANLVSNPQAIDTTLDEVRVITSQMGQSSDRQVPAEKEQPLMNAYLRLEQYLTEQEQVRAFTRQSLRQDIAQKLRLTTGSATFWDKLPAAG